VNAQEPIDTARTLVPGNKGLLAMDESNPTCNKRFARLGIPQTEEARRAWRELIVNMPGLGECISGAILAAGLGAPPLSHHFMGGKNLHGFWFRGEM
jgi:fructose-bisphosphate aldolase, class I